jgi:hypothetical protein
MVYKGAPAWIVTKIQGVEATYMQVEHQPLDFWPNEILNKKQFEMYKAIVDYKAEHGYAPIYTELVEITGRAIATVQKRMKEIEELGLIEKHGGRAISIKGETYVKPWPMKYFEEHPDAVTRTKK